MMFESDRVVNFLCDTLCQAERSREILQSVIDCTVATVNELESTHLIVFSTLQVDSAGRSLFQANRSHCYLQTGFATLAKRWCMVDMLHWHGLV